MGKSIILLSITLVLGLTFGANSPAYADSEQLQGFEAEYIVYRFDRSLGKAKLSLKADKNDLYRLDYYSKVSAFFLSDVRSETSFFTFSDQQLHPLTYAYSRSGTGSNKSTKIHFDAEKSTVTVNQAQPIEWTGQLDNQLYRLDVQLKLASGKREFEYNIVNNRGELRHYELKVVGKEQLDLPFGMIEGIKVKIIRNNSSRETIAWFSPQLNYQLVKLQQFKDGDEQGEIRLKYFKSESIQPETKN
ncbi:DUF3108 domain-containing protein [Paraglaciecola arctica]|uniref:DUF3108 domain-containing protein n=1 Tax=Paraglaciecola arctica BSs20135 TaxID=493475 RepID=K6YNZ2_9ALTE|nr:DUF3108 domain-containing protein [Paraglaciecola arctica]GAC18333.1 hypothetical protein GARC_1357 [Paraglaciecola arctica BSs20135]